MYLVLKIKIGFKKLSNHMQVHRHIRTVVILDLTPAKIYYLSEEEQVLI